MEMKEFAKGIKPSVHGKSDKYSWRMYKRALKKGRESVYLMAWDSVAGRVNPSLDELKNEHIRGHIIAIGKMHSEGWFYGKRLSDICRDGGSLMDWAYSPQFHTSEWIDITDWFWREYQEHGRCRFFKSEHVWKSINKNARRCIHCGKQQRRTIETKKTIERIEVWK